MATLEYFKIRIFQASSELFKELYGDPRGKFDGLTQRKKWYPQQFTKDGELDMRGWKEAFCLDKAEGYLFFRDVKLALEVGKPFTACELLFHKFNQDRDLKVLNNHFGFYGHSMSTGDVIELTIEPDNPQYYYCDMIGFELIKVKMIDEKGAGTNATN